MEVDHWDEQMQIDNLGQVMMLCGLFYCFNETSVTFNYLKYGSS